MNTLFRTITLFVVLMASPLSAQDAFVDGLPDVPLMTGLTEDVDARLEFDKVEGRIVEVVLRGTGSTADILKYYKTALQELGWKKRSAKKGRLAFRRENESLILRADRHGRMTILTISLSPRR
ncbi:MAG: hypothetical protein KAI28_05290 [Sphingomonadales bacterium]|nr:hypothetical protein [Sphingomonadales bacterium]